MRELLRHEVYETDDENAMAPYCWTPSGRVRDLLNALGAEIGNEPRMDDSPRIYEFVVQNIGFDRARFAGDFDLPLQLITRSENRAELIRCFAETSRDAPDFGDAEGGAREDEPEDGINGE